MIRKIVFVLNKRVAEVCGWLLSIMILFLCFDIFSRMVKEPVQGIAELAVFVMISAIYLGLAQCEQQDKHIKVTALLERFPATVRRLLRIFNTGVQLVVIVILILAAYKSLIYTYEKHVAISGTVPLILWPVRLVILFGLFLYGLQSIFNLIDRVNEYFHEKKSGNE